MQFRIKKIHVLIFVAVIFGGCASTREVWRNEKLPSTREGMLQDLDDNILCGNVASAKAPMPPKREFMPIPGGGYRFSGQATTYGNTGIYNSQISGTATPANSLSSSFASGYNMGAAIGSAFAQARWEKTFAECMQTLGYTKKTVQW